MADAAGGEYALPEPSGDWLAGLVAVGEQSRAILRRHPWLAGLVITRPEHVLTVLAPHPGLARPRVQVVPVRGLPVVAAVVAFVIVAIAGAYRWALAFCNVVGGGLWTAIDLFVGLIIGPILGRLQVAARAEFTARFMPKMVLIMPTLVLMTLAAGFQLALDVPLIIAFTVARFPRPRTPRASPVNRHR